MTLKLFGVLVAIMALVMFVLSVQDPYFLSFKAPVANIENIQINHLTGYDINTKEIKAKYTARQWLRYDDKDVLKDFKAKTKTQNVSSKIAIKKGDLIILQGKVLYKDDKDTKIISPKVFYKLKEKLLFTDDSFIAFMDKNIIKGQKLIYDLDKKQLRIQDLTAWF